MGTTANGFWALALGLTLVGCSTDRDTDTTAADAPKSESTPTTETGEEMVLDIDWAPLSEGDLFGISHAIVRAQVIAEAPAARRTYPWSEELGRYLTEEEAGDDFGEIPMTVLTLAILDVVRGAEDRDGAAMAAGSEVRLVLFGGRLFDGSAIEVTGQPVPEVGDEGIFFLSSALRPSDMPDLRGAYSLTGGGQGLVPIHRGVAEPLGESPIATQGRVPVDRFLAFTKERAATVPSGRAYPAASRATRASQLPSLHEANP